MLFCTKCGKQNLDKAKFCTGCGAPFSAIVITRPEQKRNAIFLITVAVLLALGAAYYFFSFLIRRIPILTSQKLAKKLTSLL